MSQETQIIRHLKRGPITPLQALSRYGILRLAARINSLRGKGHKIDTQMIERDGKRYARYRMVKS